MQVLWSNEQEKLILPQTVEQLLHNTANLVATRFNLAPSAEISVAFMDDEAIAELNLEYRGLAGPTDVLSFAFAEGEEVYAPLDAPLMLGDIYISVERAEVQALEYGHSLERELAYLLVHGLLHLLGYEHDEANEGEMKQLNEELVRELGYTR